MATAPEDVVLPISEALAVAQRHQRQGQIAAAKRIYETILADSPGQPDALHFLGLLHYQLGRNDQAIHYLERAITLSPDYADAWNNLGNVYQTLGNLEQAELAYRHGLEYAPSADVWNNLGILLRRLGRLAEAEQAYRQAILLRPSFAMAFNNLGRLLQERGDLPGATEQLQHALVLAPEAPEVLHNLGNALALQQQHEAAQQIYRRAVAAGADAYTELATVLRERGLVEDAISAYRRALDINPQHTNAYYYLGMLLSACGRREEAVHCYQQWSEQEPGNPVALHMLAACGALAIPPQADDRYVETLFDGFANSFERRLASLDYQAPHLVVEAFARCMGAPNHAMTIVDAGCGTGLCGPLLRPYAERLIGVDLSRPMLDQARLRGDYDELIKQELTAFFQQQPPASLDAIVSADTLVYFGALQTLFGFVASSLKIGGCLAGSVEQLSAPATLGYHLNPHGRYSHALDYLHNVLAQCGLALQDWHACTLRQEMGMPVIGIVFTALRQ